MSQDRLYKIHIWTTWTLVNNLDPLVFKWHCDSCVTVSNCDTGSLLPGLSLIYPVYLYIFFTFLCRTPFKLWTLKSSSTSYLEYQAGGGGEGLVDLVNQLTLERCHSFWFYGSCRKRIPIRDSSMPKRMLSQCGVSSKMFIGLIVPTTCFSVRWD